MPTPKIKYDFYQTEAFVIITIMAKNTEAVNVQYGETTVSYFHF